jgi:hypothetical protein
MSITVNHKFVSPKAEQSDSTLVGPNEWNAIHSAIDTSNILVAQDYNFVPITSGGSLVIGSNSIVLNPLPQGITIGGYLYISGGSGTAEAVPITGLSGNTAIVTCVNTHGGGWTVQSASGGLQEAIGAANPTGNKIIIANSLTLRANVVSLGKMLFIEKLAGAVITGAFNIINARSISTQKENYSNTIANSYAALAPPSDIETVASDQPVQWYIGDMGKAIGRSVTMSPGNNYGIATLGVEIDSTGAALTPQAIVTMSRLWNNTSSNGSTSISAYIQGNTGTTSEIIGLHGQADTYWAPTANCTNVGVNAEGSVITGGGSGVVALIGLESNMNTLSPANAPATVLGAQIQMNNPGNMSASSVGVQVQANTGVVPKGIYITDTSGGYFANPLTINSNQTMIADIFINNSQVTTTAISSFIDFARGAIGSGAVLARFEATHNNGDFSTGQLKFYTAGTTSVGPKLALTIDQNQKVTVAKTICTTPTTVAGLPPSASSIGCWATVTDSSVNTWGSPLVGGGTFTVGVFCGASGWTVCSK